MYGENPCDSADRVTSIVYPTGETVAQTYNGRGLPYSVSGSVATELVSSAFYNALGSVTEINLGNGLRTTYGYYGTGGAYDTTGGYYGRLWQITTLPQGGGDALMDVMHSWDAAGNLVTRQSQYGQTSETETFGYDFLDRLTAVSGAYASSYEYDEIGNMVSRNGVGYSYDSTQPHAVDSVGGLPYTYDANGNMRYRGSDNQTITWDAENRPVTVSANGSVIATFIYDGDGNRIKKTEAGETVLYINKYYEKNLTSGNVTTSYYLGSRLVAQREGEEVRFIHQDHLSGTSLTTTDNGSVISSIKYFPYGDTRSGDVPTDVKFTGQRLDSGTGLYYYGARYYDPLIGRFISADTVIPDPMNPQAFNRYTYCMNNPLKYVDPSGHKVYFCNEDPYVVELTQAWEKYRALSPNHAEFLMTCEDPILIRSVTDKKYKGLTSGDSSSGQVIYINVIEIELGNTAAVLSHEVYHAIDGFQGATAEEEIKAFQYQNSLLPVTLWSLLGKWNDVYNVDLTSGDLKTTITRWQSGLNDDNDYKKLDPLKPTTEIPENRPGYLNYTSTYYNDAANEYGGTYQYQYIPQVNYYNWYYYLYYGYMY